MERKKEIEYAKLLKKGTIPLADEEKLINLYRKYNDMERIANAEEFQCELNGAEETLYNIAMTSKFFSGIGDSLASKVACKRFIEHGGEDETLTSLVAIILTAWEVSTADLTITKTVFKKLNQPLPKEIALTIELREHYQQNQKKKALIHMLLHRYGGHLSSTDATDIAKHYLGQD